MCKLQKCEDGRSWGLAFREIFRCAQSIGRFSFLAKASLGGPSDLVGKQSGVVLQKWALMGISVPVHFPLRKNYWGFFIFGEARSWDPSDLVEKAAAFFKNGFS